MSSLVQQRSSSRIKKRKAQEEEAEALRKAKQIEEEKAKAALADDEKPKKTTPNEQANPKKRKAEGSAKLTPGEIYFNKRDDFIEKNDLLGSLLVRGIKGDEDASEDEDEDEAPKTVNKDELTEDQLGRLCFILISKNRDKELDAMKKLVLGDENSSRYMMFNTSFSYTVMDSWYTMRNYLSNAKIPARKFDRLFAYTYWLKEYDFWMHDNEGGMEVLTKGLASAWKRLLKYSDQDLGIDAYYTRPGIVELLEQFRSAVESIDMYGVYPSLKFKFT